LAAEGAWRLAGTLRTRWNTSWAGAGFIHNSTAVPATVALRLTLVNQLVDFFTANPTFAVAGIEVTAAKASSLSDTATTARGSANGAEPNLKTKQDQRTTAEAALVKMMRGLTKILSMKLSRTDGRWTQFGLSIPATPSTPSQPQEVAVVAQPGHTIVATCAPTPLATRYRWRIKVLGVDAEFRLGPSTTAPLAEIKSVEAGPDRGHLRAGRKWRIAGGGERNRARRPATRAVSGGSGGSLGGGRSRRVDQWVEWEWCDLSQWT